MIFAFGCTNEIDDLAQFPDEVPESKADAVEGVLMPRSIVARQRELGWGAHHLEWHLSRRYDSLPPAAIEWLTSQGIRRHFRQEGAPENGRSFLFMHRAMIEVLTEEFPTSAWLFRGWDSPPRGSDDPTNPITAENAGRFDPDMEAALVRLEEQLDSFTSEDEFGRYLQTNMRPTDAGVEKDPDPTAGVHNYLHQRFSDPASPVDVGNPAVNLENRVFWRIHGWIDARWQAYRELEGLEDDVEFRTRIEFEKFHLRMGHTATKSFGEPPDEVRKSFFANL